VSLAVKTREEVGLGKVERDFYPDGYYFLSMPQEDREVFYALIEKGRPRRYFEFGTGRGTSIDTVRAVVPDCEIWSLDVYDPAVARKCNKGLGPLDPEAHYLVLNSHGWIIPDLLLHHFDMILVDGGHELACVAADTARAMQMIAPGGMIVWHDICVGNPNFDPHRYLAGKGCYEYFPYEVTWVKGTTVGFWQYNPDGG
jgi:predicted O-methyltransferase YrrM